MMPTIAETALRIYQRYWQSGQQFSTKQIIDDLCQAIEAGECAEDPVRDRAYKAVAAVDKAQRRRPDPEQQQLDLGDFTFPSVLVLGGQDRQPANTALLEEVLADFSIKSKSHADQNQAFALYGNVINRVLPYLQRGMTLAAAVEAWKQDSDSEHP